jgi:hypothetical protein
MTWRLLWSPWRQRRRATSDGRLIDGEGPFHELLISLSSEPSKSE